MSLRIYKKGLGPIAATGLTKPIGERILVRAIYAQDAFETIDTNEATLDIKDAVCFEIMSVGSKVHGDIEVGLHCDHRSAAFDSLDWTAKESRWATVHQDDVCLVWDPKVIAKELPEG